MQNCPDCSVRPSGPGGHDGLRPGGPLAFRQSLFTCSVCEQLWRRHSGGADTYYWQAETLPVEFPEGEDTRH